MQACAPFGEYVSAPRIGCADIRFLRFDSSVCGPCSFETGSVVRFWLWSRSATGNSAYRSRHLSTDVVTRRSSAPTTLEATAPTGARAFQSWSRPCAGIWRGGRRSETIHPLGRVPVVFEGLRFELA